MKRPAGTPLKKGGFGHMLTERVRSGADQGENENTSLRLDKI